MRIIFGNLALFVALTCFTPHSAKAITIDFESYSTVSSFEFISGGHRFFTPGNSNSFLTNIWVDGPISYREFTGNDTNLATVSNFGGEAKDDSVVSMMPLDFSLFTLYSVDLGTVFSEYADYVRIRGQRNTGEIIETPDVAIIPYNFQTIMFNEQWSELVMVQFIGISAPYNNNDSNLYNFDNIVINGTATVPVPDPSLLLLSGTGLLLGGVRFRKWKYSYSQD